MTGHTHWVNSVTYSPSGKYLVSGSSDKRICVWEALTGLLVWCTRSASMPLFSLGLRLSESMGLRPGQCALLASAGCEEANAMKEKVLTLGQNRHALWESRRVETETQNLEKKSCPSGEGQPRQRQKCSIT